MIFCLVTNYDAAVYNAVSAYATGGPSVSRGNGMGFKKGTSKGMGMGGKPQRPMPKPQTLHYCDVCKISCAGPQVCFGIIYDSLLCNGLKFYYFP